MAIDVSSELVFLIKKRRINMDVSSGLIFLTQKKEQTEVTNQTEKQKERYSGNGRASFL